MGGSRGDEEEKGKVGEDFIYNYGTVWEHVLLWVPGNCICKQSVHNLLIV